MRKLFQAARSLLLPSIVLILGLSIYAGAQNINKALQLSQDPTGSFGVDTSNNVYFPAHVLGSGTAPVVSSCGTTPSILGTDIAGQVTEGSTVAVCTVTFNTAYLAKPWCVVTAQTANTTSPISYIPYTTGIYVSHSAQAAGQVWNYFCSGRT